MYDNEDYLFVLDDDLFFLPEGETNNPETPFLNNKGEKTNGKTCPKR